VKLFKSRYAGRKDVLPNKAAMTQSRTGRLEFRLAEKGEPLRASAPPDTGRLSDLVSSCFDLHGTLVLQFLSSPGARTSKGLSMAFSGQKSASAEIPVGVSKCERGS